MTERFRPFRSRQNSARRRSRNTNRRRFEMLEDRRLLAADMSFASDVLNQGLDAPSDDLSVTALTAAAAAADSAAVQIGENASIDGANAGPETPVDAAVADQVFGLAGDYNGDSTVDHDDYREWKAGFGTVGSHGGIVDAAAYTVWRDNLGATTVNSPSDSLSASGDAADKPEEEVSFGGDVLPMDQISFEEDDRPTEQVLHGGDVVPVDQVTLDIDDGSDAGAGTPVDAAIADHKPQPPVDTSFAGETPVDADAIDQVFELDDDAARGDLGTNSPADTLEGNEGDTSDASSNTQPSVDAGTDGFPGGLLDTAPGAEPTGPDDTGVEFGIWDWLFGMDYDDVKTRDDLPDPKKPQYDKYATWRALNPKKSHEDACKANGIDDPDGKWGKIFKRVYENDN